MAKRRYFKELKMSQLHALTALAGGKGFAGAAALLEVATPSVWQQVRGLEDEFKVSLVEVDGQKVRLTEAGNLLVLLSKPLVQNFDQLREQFMGLLDDHSLHLRLAAPNNVLVNELLEPLRQFREKYPRVSLRLTDSPSNPARLLLEAGEIDLAIVGLLEKELPSSLAMDHISDFPFMLVCSADHPLLKARKLQAKQFVPYPLIMPSVGTNGRRRTDEVFTKAGLVSDLKIAFETSTKELLLRYAQMDFGIAIAPISPRFLADPMARLIAKNLAFRDVSDLFGVEHLVILRRQDRHEPKPQKAFRETVLTLLAKE